MTRAGDLPDVEALLTRATTIATHFEEVTCSFQTPQKMAEVEEFLSKVQALRLKYEFWKTQQQKFGKLAGSWSLGIAPVAIVAMQVLEVEEPRIRKLNQPWRNCISAKYSRRNQELPVKELNAALQKVLDAFDSLPKGLRGSRKSSISPLDVPMRMRHSRLPFGPEKRYIPLRRSAARIRRALESQHGPQMVVLHGGPGTGKSSLARYLALHYQDGEPQGLSKSEEELQRDSFQFSASGSVLTHQTSSTRSTISEVTTVQVGSRFPGGVFYVPCIQGTNIIDKQLQLLQDLGFTPPIGKLSHLNLDEIHNRLQKKLTEFLAKRDALVVIDNVWDPDIVRALFIRGSRVKYLVTTQDARLCEDDYDAVSIPIEQVGLETARRILASHTTIVDDPEAQEVLDAVVNLTMANPSALINVSMTVLRTNDLEEWKDLRNTLEAVNLLRTQQDDSYMAATFPREIPRIIGCSMMLALESLPLGVEKLLVALAALEGTSVPQVVVQLLVKSTQGSLASFSRHRNFLEDRALIRVHRQTAWWSSSVIQTIWSIDTLLQRFIQATKAKAVASIVEGLFSGSGIDPSAESDHILTVTLCAVYGSPKVAERAAMKLGASSHATDLQSKLWAGPLVSLFQATEARTEEEKRKQEIHHYARQVFLAYVTDENPDKGGMRGLLASPVASRPTCWAIAWAVPNQKRALFARSAETLQGLVNLVGKVDDDANCSDMQECASAALWNLSMAAETKVVVAHAPGLLEEVVQLMIDASGKNENVQRHAAGIVASLASEKDNQVHLAAFPGVIQGLVALLRDFESSSNVQVYAAHALMHLTNAWPNKEPIAAFPGALEGLVELMEGSSCVHEIAVGAILNLSVAPDNKPLIATFPGALDNLVGLLAESFSVLAQKRAAAALGNLTSEKFLEISLFPGVLEKLVSLLSEAGRPELQDVAAKILGNLAASEDNAATIAGFPGAWRGLLMLLSEDMILEVQVQALDTIALLTMAGPVSGVAIAIEELFGLLAENQVNSGILEKVLLAILRILDTGDGKNFVAISKFPNALYQLVHLLGKFEFSHIQEIGAKVLATLAKWKPNRVPIAHFPRALDGLLDLLANGVKPSIQVIGLKTLWHLAHGKDVNRKMIAEWPGALLSIVALLEKDAPQPVQLCAALVLSTLAGVEGKYVNPEEIPSVLDKLSELLLADSKVSPSVQQEAAKTRALLDWESTNLLIFNSSDAYAGRGRANAQLGMLRQALADFDMAVQSMWDTDFTLQRVRLDEESADHELELDLLHGKIAHVLSNRAYVKAVLKDYHGALRDADSALELQPRDSLLWQERGVLKRLMGDLAGSLEDLEASLQMSPDDYETLKHCGFVYFLLADHETAYSIAERALEVDLDQGYDPPDGDEYCRLGKLPVTFLEFTLP